MADDGEATVTGARHRVVVVGGGFGGLLAVRRLARHPVDVTLIDRRNHHLFQPLLYQVATGILSPGQIAPVLRHLLRRSENVRVVLAEVCGFDLDKRLVNVATIPGDDHSYPYDSLIVAAGAGQSYFGHDEYALHAPGMKTLDDALELRRRVLGALELAECATSDEERQFWMTMVVVGAGPTGVELAGQIKEMAVRSLVRDFRSIDTATLRVVLVDAGAAPLTTFGGHLSKKAEDQLTEIGVELLMHGQVTDVGVEGVTVKTPDGEMKIRAATTIWAAGVAASPLAAMLAKQSGAAVDRAGRIEVLPTLTLPGHPEVFCVGDMVSLDGLPGVCEVAMQGGLHAAGTIGRRVTGDDRELPFKYRDLGSAAAIGRFKAIVDFHGVKLSGVPGWVVWLFVHIAFLTGFGNRTSTMLRWCRAMIGRARPERVFSFGHTGGDLSLPEAALRIVQPTPFPAGEATHWAAVQEDPPASDDGTPSG
jgi:NADH:ubiquinone reductase (H+-translocating)